MQRERNFRRQKINRVPEKKQEEGPIPLYNTVKRKKKEENDIFGQRQQESTKSLIGQMMQTLNKIEEDQKKYGNQYKGGIISQTFKIKDLESRRNPHELFNKQKRKERVQLQKRMPKSPKTIRYQQKIRELEKDEIKKQQRPQINKNACNRYLRNSQVIGKDYGLDQKITKLKKLFKDQFKDIYELNVNASKIYPMIYFQFLDGQHCQETVHVHLRDTFKRIKSLRKKRQLFQAIFDKTYDKVLNKFHDLSIFAIQKGKSINVNLSKESIFKRQQEYKIMFYYVKEDRQKVVNFTLFDCSMRSFEFDSKFIQSWKLNHPQQHSEEYKLFKIFEGSIFKQQKQGLGNDLLDNQELQSDKEGQTAFKEKEMSQIRKNVYRILDKDILKLDEIILKKQNEMQEQAQRDHTSIKFKKILQQFEDLSQNKENFINTRKEVLSKLYQNKESSNILKICYKKLILAQKQLQSKLPIVTKKRKIFQLLRNKRQNLLIIEGQTGSGKSTQLPQMLCQFYNLFEDNDARPVLVTQPRKLATRTLAERVAKQMGENVGGFVDYVASAGKQASSNAKIVFKLDRLVLDEITEDRLLSKYSCLVLDEAHERTISIDVILGLVKDLLKKRNDFKVIVTSASMDTNLFQTYFGTKTLKVSGRTFPVSIKYIDEKDQDINNKNHQTLHKIKKVIENQIMQNSSSLKNEYQGHMLCFCSGVDEISQLVKHYQQKLNKKVFDVFALHGKVTPSDQKKVFQDTGKYKFIFASRIAETAVTIDGVKVVIDPGKDIQLAFDQKYKVSSMKLQQITQSSAKQRAGRSGRTGPGHCFRLYSEQDFNKRKPNKVPEIKNSSLETVVLRLKTLKIDNVITFPYIQKPDTQGLKKSIELLTLIGALEPKTQTVTKIGKLLIKLPIEPFLSRAIIQALIYDKIINNYRNFQKLKKIELQQTLQRGVCNTVIQILAMVINFSNLFFIKAEDRQEGQFVKFIQFSDEDGDFFFLDNIYKIYKQLSEKDTQGKILTQKNNIKLNQWIKEKFLNFRTLKQINQLVIQIKKILRDYSIDASFSNEISQAKEKLKKCTTFREIVLSCLITSFSANLCKFSGNDKIGYTIVNQRRPIQIYGTSNLSLLGIKSDWIICYDLYTSQQGRFYCKLAHKVDYCFMKDHISSYILQKFDVKELQENNPFYKEFTIFLPTRFIQQIKFDSYKSDKYQQYKFLGELFPCFFEQINKVSFFIQNNGQKNSLVKKKEEQLEYYLSKMKKQHAKQFRHNFIGNIFINLSDGFQIKSIQFNNKEFCVQIIAPKDHIGQWIETYCRKYGETFAEDIKKKQKHVFQFPQQKIKIKIFISQQKNKDELIQYLTAIKNILFAQKIIIDFKQSLVDKRRKIPQTKILLHFFAGTCQKNNLLIYYGQEDGVDVSKQLQFIQSGIYKKQQMGRDRKLLPSQMHLTKKRNGINVYQCKYDEYEIIEELFQMQKDHLLTFGFQFPKFIKKFREPEISQARKNDEEWKAEISNLLQKTNITKQNVVINIFGFPYRGKKGEKLSILEKSFRIDMNVKLTTLDTSVYNKLKAEYDGKNKIIGCQKLHVRMIFEQVITIPLYQTFYALQQEYRQFVYDYKTKYPLMKIQQILIKTRKKQKMLIKAVSSNRQDFIQPQRVINKLFSPKIIKLQATQFRVASKTDQGQQVLKRIEQKYDYKIYFEIQRMNNSLKVYCDDSELGSIQKQIKEEFKKCRSYEEDIYYRGKNLNKVKQILQKYNLSYQIIFKQRKIRISADPGAIEIVKNQILKLSKSEKGQCLICLDIMRSPYRMINCQCKYCWLCLIEHIRAFRNSVIDRLCCPNEDCLKAISVFDVRTLLTQEQFENICDIKVKKYLEKSDKYISCNYCQNIFDKIQVQKAEEMDCGICGKRYCIKCNDYHPDYKCDQWKNRDSLKKQQLDKLGIKQCPKCKTGIQKTEGCHHMECKNCKAHICWKCLQVFKQSKDCYDHLAKECKGIF